MKKFYRLFFQLILAGVILVLIWAAFNYSLVIYGFGQLKGQLGIVMNARPLKEILSDTLVADSVKQKIKFIDEIRRFAVDSIGLKDSKNYTTFYDQKNKPLLWVLTASEPFNIKAYEWNFPLLGNVSYKGFFNYENGKGEEEELRALGFDTEYGEVSAWSTLGWFTDPILSNMLNRGKGSLAELIIHELTHSTIYLKSSVNMNENLATVCGEVGAVRFLKSKYGEESDELAEYLNREEDYNRLSTHMLHGASLLDSVYSVMRDSSVLRKKVAKDKMILDIVSSLDTISFKSKSRYKNLFKKSLPNNAYFVDFIRYDSQKDEMKIELEEKFDGNIRNYIEHLRKRN